MKSMLNYTANVVMLLFITSNCFSATCSAIANGNWNDPATWSCATVPGCGDLVIVPAGFTVLVDDHVMLDETSMPVCSTATNIQVFGILQFQTGKKMELACGSIVEIMSGGLLQNGGGGGSSNWLKICDIIHWRSINGNIPGYRLYGEPIPLSSELLNFEKVNKGSGVSIVWSMTSDESVVIYTIEFSADGKNWKKVASVPSKASQSIFTYQIELPSESVPFGYYCLNSINENGKVKTLALESHYFEKWGASVFPNPIQSGQLFKIQFDVQLETELVLQLSDINGAVKSKFSVPIGTTRFEGRAPDLEAGIYFLRTEGEDAPVTRVIVLP